jgi:predicted lipoprotein with Yx(FWY)xxD motif
MGLLSPAPGISTSLWSVKDMRAMRLPALVLAAVFLLAACGSSGSKSSTSTTASTTATTVAAATTTAPAGAAAIIKTANTSLGTILVDGQGRTLYHRTDESATHIVCTGQCASTWPPLFAQGTTGVGNVGPLSTVMRPDGKNQAAAAGQPLYTFVGDAKAGDTNGQGVGGIWFVIKAQGA